MLFLFNDPATTENYTLSLHDALPIYRAFAPAGRTARIGKHFPQPEVLHPPSALQIKGVVAADRFHEHTSELQSAEHHVRRHRLDVPASARVDHRVRAEAHRAAGEPQA